MIVPESSPPMSDEEFRLLRDFVHGYCGIYFDQTSRFLLEHRLARRLKQHGFSRFTEYYHFLKYDKQREEELAAVVDVLTTNETYFFREEYQLKALTEEILPEVRERNKAKRTLSIWSAGCSTGEEPYTIAMLLLEQGTWSDWKVDILGSDISQRVLASARKGVYRGNAFRATPEALKDRYFTPEGDGFRIADRVRRWVSFASVNLLDPGKTALVGTMDIILCRNVIIYFDQTAKKSVIGMFLGKLADGGFLLLGHSESLINLSTAFTLRHFRHDMVYQKPVPAGAARSEA